MIEAKAAEIDQVPNWKVPEFIRWIILATIVVVPVFLYIVTTLFSFTYAAGSLVLVAVALLSFVSTRAGLALLMVYIALESLLLNYTPSFLIIFFRLIPEVIIGSLFTKGLAQVLMSRQNNQSAAQISAIRNPVIYPLVFFIGFSILSILVNRVEPLSFIVGLRLILRFILLYQALILLKLGRRDINFVVVLFAGLLLFEAGMGLLQSVIGGPLDEILSRQGGVKAGGVTVLYEIWQQRGEGTRIFATMGRYDQLGTFLSVGLAMLLGFLYNGSQKAKRAAMIIALFALPALVLTYSRASWFAFLIGLIAVAVIIKRDRRVLAALMLAVVMVGSYVGIREIEVRRMIDDPQFSPVQRLLEAFSVRRIKSEYTGKGRTYFIIETPKALFPEKAVLGMGPGMFGGGAVVLLQNTDAYDELNLPFGIYGTDGQIDNSWISILGETGVLGLGAYFLMFMLILRFCYRTFTSPDEDWLASSLALGLFAATLAFMVQGFFASYFEVRTVAAYYWLLAAITVLAAQQSRIKYPRPDENITDQ